MIPAIAELLMAANLTIGAPATLPHVETLPASPTKITAKAVEALKGTLAKLKCLDESCEASCR